MKWWGWGWGWLGVAPSSARSSSGSRRAASTSSRTRCSRAARAAAALPCCDDTCITPSTDLWNASISGLPGWALACAQSSCCRAVKETGSCSGSPSQLMTPTWPGQYHVGGGASRRDRCSISLTWLVRLVMAHRTRRMSPACHISSPNTALHSVTTSPTWIIWHCAAGDPSWMAWMVILPDRGSGAKVSPSGCSSTTMYSDSSRLCSPGYLNAVTGASGRAPFDAATTTAERELRATLPRCRRELPTDTAMWLMCWLRVGVQRRGSTLQALGPDVAPQCIGALKGAWVWYFPSYIAFEQETAIQ
ncbi:hypothetical protein V8C86DRAFT_2840676 [Haematococcus lacustris]